MEKFLFNFGSLTGVSGSASAERRFQPQKGYNPSPGSFTHPSVFARLPNFGLDTGAFSQFRRNELLVPSAQMIPRAGFIRYVHLRGQRRIVLDTDATVLAPSHHRLLTAPTSRGLEVSEGMSRLPSVSGLSRNPHHNMVLGL
jgi:hypothetical protein